MKATDNANAALQRAQKAYEDAGRELKFAELVQSTLPVPPENSLAHPLHGCVGSVWYNRKTRAEAVNIFQAFAAAGMVRPHYVVRDSIYTSIYALSALTDKHRSISEVLALTKPWTSMDAELSFHAQLPTGETIGVGAHYPLNLLGRYVKDDPRRKVHFRWQWEAAEDLEHMRALIVYGGYSTTGDGSRKTPVYAFTTEAELLKFAGLDVVDGSEVVAEGGAT